MSPKYLQLEIIGYQFLIFSVGIWRMLNVFKIDGIRQSMMIQVEDVEHVGSKSFAIETSFRHVNERCYHIYWLLSNFPWHQPSLPGGRIPAQLWGGELPVEPNRRLLRWWWWGIIEEYSLVVRQYLGLSIDGLDSSPNFGRLVLWSSVLKTTMSMFISCDHESLSWCCCLFLTNLARAIFLGLSRFLSDSKYIQALRLCGYNDVQFQYDVKLWVERHARYVRLVDNPIR